MDLLFDTPSEPADGEALEAALKATGNVVLSSNKAVITDGAYSVDQWIEPMPHFAQAAAAVGAAGVTFDPDGVLRRTSLFIGARPTLAAAAAELHGGYQRSQDSDEPVLIHFAGPSRRGIVTVSYYQALDAAELLPRDIFRDKVVFVGRSLSSASAVAVLSDYFMTPLATMAGVEVHANVFDTLLRNRAIRDPFGTRHRFAVFCLSFAVLGAALLYPAGAMTGLIAMIGGAAGLVATSYVSLARFQTHVPAVVPTLALAAVYTVTIGYRFALGQRERRFIKRAS